MKKVLFFFIGTLITISAQKKLTLEEAVSIALQNNTSLIKTKNSLTYSESNVTSAYGNLFPSVSAGAGIGWNKYYLTGNESESRSANAGISGGVVLFDGLANIATINQSKNDLQSAEFSLEKLKQDIVFEATSLYYTVINAEKLLKVREDNVKYNQKFLETIQERNKLGSVAIADVYAQQVQAGNAELLQIQAENDLENAKSDLLNYLSLDVLEEYTFEDVSSTITESESDAYINEFESIALMVNEALKNRYDYKGKELDVKSADDAITIARGGIFPSVSASYNLFSAQADALSNLYKNNNYSHGVGLDLSIPIFSNFNVDNRIQYAKVNALNTQEDLTALERLIKIQVKQGYLDLQAAKKQLDVSNKNVVSAGENRRVNNERYNLGSGTILDVLQADKDYQQALSDQINAQFRYFELRDKLMNYLGVLDYKKFE